MSVAVMHVPDNGGRVAKVLMLVNSLQSFSDGLSCISLQLR